MAIKLTLNPKNDQLVPIKALQEWSNEYLNLKQEANWIKKLFSGKEGKVKRERIGEINNVIKNLKTSGSNRAWFIKVFLKPWGGKATDEAKLIFDALSDDKAFDRLQQAAEEFQGKLKVATDAAAVAAKALTDRISNESNGLAKIAADFSKEFKKYDPKAQAATQPAASAAQPAAGTVDQAKFQSAFNKASNAKPGQPITRYEWMKALLDELEPASETSVPTTAAGGTVTAPLEESSIVDRFKMDKKLYEAGLIERSEYLASLAEAKKTLLEKKRNVRDAVDAALKQAQTENVLINTVQDLQTYMKQVPAAKSITLGQSYNADMLNRAKQAARYSIVATPEAAPTEATPEPDENTLYTELEKKHKLTKDAVNAEWQRLTAIFPDRVVAATAPAAAPISESFMLTKRLYEAGLIDRSEYLAALVKTKKVLAEDLSSMPGAAGATTGGTTGGTPQGGAPAAGAAPTAAAPAQQPNPAVAAVGSAISTIIGENDQQQGAIGILLGQSSALQDALTRIGQQQVAESALTAKQQQLAKLYFKKQVLSEYAKTGEVANKIQLNEFFLTALLLSALAGAIAWATSKLAGFFKDSHTGYSSSYDTPRGNPQQQVVSVTSGIGAGMDADGNLVDGSGNKVANFQQEIEKYKAAFNKPAQNITNAVRDINTNVSTIPALKDSPAYIAFTQAFANSPNQEITALFTKLEAIKEAL